MIVIVNKRKSKSEFNKKLKSLNGKKLDLKKYSGILPKDTDGIKYQKEIRSEWK